MRKIGNHAVHFLTPMARSRKSKDADENATLRRIRAEAECFLTSAHLMRSAARQDSIQASRMIEAARQMREQLGKDRTLGMTPRCAIVYPASRPGDGDGPAS
jgi:hypothetical protein